jgi:hypothetical protein
MPDALVATATLFAPWVVRFLSSRAKRGIGFRGTSTDEESKPMRRSNFALRLQPSLMEEARRVAEAEAVALNQLINVALAKKVSALRTEEYFQERARRADRAETLRILERAGKGNSPIEGDELPPDWEREGQIKKSRRKATPRARVSRR